MQKTRIQDEEMNVSLEAEQIFLDPIVQKHNDRKRTRIDETTATTFWNFIVDEYKEGK